MQLARRDVAGRYRGSVMGVLWTLLNPLLLLLVYTFVFGVVFKARWQGGGAGGTPGTYEFAVILFAGLTVHMLFAECISRAPTIILHNSNFVKRVVFPLEIYPLVILGAALFHQLMHLVVLLAAIFIVHGNFAPTVFYLPVIWLPFWLLLLGGMWLLASLGVYLRDIGQVIAMAVTVLLFLSPVFYPVDVIPEPLRSYLYFNPLTLIIQQTRAVLLWGIAPDWQALAWYYGAALAACLAGYAFFQRTRKGFADVL